MADPELEAIRARRLQEMQMQLGKPGNSASVFLFIFN